MIPAYIINAIKQKENEKQNEIHVGSVGIYRYTDMSDSSDDGNDIDNDDDVIVYETKGGSPPPPATPMQEANATSSLERTRAEIAAEKEARAKSIEDAAYADRIQKAVGKQRDAYQYTQDYMPTQLGARGISEQRAQQYKLNDMYNMDINKQRGGIAEDNINPYDAYNTKTAFNDALGIANSTYQSDLRKGIQANAGDGFEYQMFADTADDDFLSQILNTRQSDAQAQIDMAKSRGQLNDGGYARAQTSLGEQSLSSMADLQDLGLGVLSGYRDNLRTMRDDELNRVSTFGLQDDYNLDVFNDRLSTTKNDLSGRLEGDLFRAVDGQSFFDPNKIISGAGALQGYYNPTTPGTAPTAATNPLLDQFKKTPAASGSNNGVF